MKIAIDADCNGIQLKELLLEYFSGGTYMLEDLDYAGQHPDCDYPDVAFHLAQRVQCGEFDKGVLICGTGLGMAIAANKVKGVFAGSCSDIYAAERLAKSNNAQIIAIGALVTGPESAKKIVTAFLESDFQGGQSERKVSKIRQFEESTQAAL